MTTTNQAADTVVLVTLLGGFSLEVNGNLISDQQNQMNKLWNLLAYMIVHRDRMVSQKEFVEQFWPEEIGAAPLNALKTQLFRIRKLLEPLFGEDVRPILSYRGGYQWNPQLQTKTDVDELASLAERVGRPDSSCAKREALLQTGMKLYRGTLLPKLAQYAWVQELEAEQKQRYLDLVLCYGDILEKRKDHHELLQLLQHATEIYPVEEALHTGIVRSLLQQGRHIEALAHYELAIDLLYRNLGVQPWRELRELYDQIMATEQLFEADLSLIQEELSETEKKEGAFFCEYGVFREIYRLEARRAKRTGTATHIMLFTALNPDGTTPDPKAAERVMQRLREAMQKALRSGDVCTRYSSMQYLVLLPDTSYQESEGVVGRILNKLWRYRAASMKVSARIRELTVARAEPIDKK